MALPEPTPEAQRAKTGNVLPVVHTLHAGLGPLAVGRARRWVKTQLEGWSDDGMANAVLVLSELATNAVLHARAPIVVTVRRRGPWVRVEVDDQDGTSPTEKHYGPGASTGRGLQLVGILAEAWGVEKGPGSKVVWAELTDPPGTPLDYVGGPGPPGPASPSPATSVPAMSATGSAHPEVVNVRLLGVPLALFKEASEHADALRREFALIVEADPGQGVPSSVMDFARQVGAHFQSAGPAILARANEADGAGQDRFDVEMAVPPTAWAVLQHLAVILDEADRYCEQGGLLTLASSPAVRRLRWWYSEQVRCQLTGHPPVPWS